MHNRIFKLSVGLEGLAVSGLADKYISAWCWLHYDEARVAVFLFYLCFVYYLCANGITF